MPIAIKDFTWQETETTVYITVPLKGVHPKNVDILSTETYIKVHYPPYIFESFLKEAVYDQKSAAQVGNGAVVFKLEKQEPRVWEQLHNPNTVNNKQEQMVLREAAQKRLQERSEEQRKEKAELKREHDRFGVKQQMALEDIDHKRIEEEKQQERTRATEELEKWKIQQEAMAKAERVKLEALKVQKEEERKTQIESKTKKKASDIFKEEAGNTPLRDPGKICVSFTPRVFPTAARESLAADEDAWLRKQAERRRIIDSENADLSEEERNPVWLQNKGNSFFQAGDYQAAINVFSHAIRMDSKLPSLFSNRGACHLKLGNMIKCVEDCSKALELLTPPVPQNAVSRCKAHVRRGTAFCELELYVEGLQDYDAAIKLDPHNTLLKEDAERIRKIIQSSGES